MAKMNPHITSHSPDPVSPFSSHKTPESPLLSDEDRATHDAAAEALGGSTSPTSPSTSPLSTHSASPTIPNEKAASHASRAAGDILKKKDSPPPINLEKVSD